jgi:hypothetical protein
MFYFYVISCFSCWLLLTKKPYFNISFDFFYNCLSVSSFSHKCFLPMGTKQLTICYYKVVFRPSVCLSVCLSVRYHFLKSWLWRQSHAILSSRDFMDTATASTTEVQNSHLPYQTIYGDWNCQPSD